MKRSGRGDVVRICHRPVPRAPSGAPCEQGMKDYLGVPIPCPNTASLRVNGKNLCSAHAWCRTCQEPLVADEPPGYIENRIQQMSKIVADAVWKLRELGDEGSAVAIENAAITLAQDIRAGRR